MSGPVLKAPKIIQRNGSAAMMPATVSTRYSTIRATGTRLRGGCTTVMSLSGGSSVVVVVAISTTTSFAAAATASA